MRKNHCTAITVFTTLSTVSQASKLNTGINLSTSMETVWAEVELNAEGFIDPTHEIEVKSSIGYCGGVGCDIYPSS